jgi:cytoskeletal protein RodZ
MAKNKQASNNKQNKKQRDEQNKNRIVAALLVILFLLLLWWLFAHNNWWPFNGDDSKKYDSSNSGTNGTNGTNGSNGSNGSDGSDGSDGGTTTPTPSPILGLSAGVENGDTKANVEANSTGVSQTCTVTANTVAAGKTEICTYSEGDKVVTVTYFNDRVVNVNRSGL